MAQTKQDFERLTYKNRPLVRNGNTIYLGHMTDNHVAMLQITSTHKVGDLEVADKVSVQIISTDTELRLKDRISKKTEKAGLYQALDIATIWLDRSNAKS